MEDKARLWNRNLAYWRRRREAAEERRSKTTAILAEARRRATYAMRAAGVTEAPVDLNRLALKLGISEVRSAPLAMRARLVVDRGRLVAELNEELEPFGKQCALAHEMAHVILERERVDLSLKTGHNVHRKGPHSLIEQLCDACAEEMLLPRDWLSKYLEHRTTSLKSVADAAQEAHLPIDFVVRRVVELRMKRWQAMWFRRTPERIEVIRSEPDWGDSVLAWIDVEDDPRSPLHMCWAANGITQGEISLRIEGQTQRYLAECTKISGNVAVSVFHLGRGKFPSAV